jgi:CheY-like chemotaxis protein
MSRPLRVLLVDDNPVDRQLAEEAFTLLDQRCTLTTADSGRAALELLMAPGAVLPDVLLLDINMPGLNGFEVLAALKSEPLLRLLPVVMLTTSANEGDIAQAYTLHASAYLLKSIHFQAMLEQIETFVEFWTRARLPHWPHLIPETNS